MCPYESICVGSAESHPGSVLVPCSALGTITVWLQGGELKQLRSGENQLTMLKCIKMLHS